MKVVSAIWFLCFSINASASKPAKISPLKILESYTLPVTEVSGMAWRTDPQTKATELVIVSDSEHKLYLVDWEKRKAGLVPRAIDLKPLEATVGAQTQSEWESVFSDETGRVFIIRENPSEILVISPDFKKVETKISLHVPEDAKKDLGWNDDLNARGEGLLPLKNGHILVVKEKNPLRIIEFAPSGKKAEGYDPKLSIEHRGTFPLPKGERVDFHPVFVWRFSADAEALMEDSSGINTDGAGEIYLLGDQRNLIGSLGKKLKEKKDLLKMSSLWSLPSAMKQPEGMVIDREGRPIIAIDRKKTEKENLFLLSPLN